MTTPNVSGDQGPVISREAPAHSSHFSGLSWLMLILGLALSGTFLAGPERARMDASATAVVLLHLVLGVLVLPLLSVGWITRAVLKSRRCPGSSSLNDPWTDRSTPGDRRLSPANGSACIALSLLACAYLAGMLIVIEACRGKATPEDLLTVHTAAGSLAAAAAGLALIHRWRGLIIRAGLVEAAGARRTPAAISGILVVLLLLCVILGAAAFTPRETPEMQYQPEAYYADLTATNARQEGNLLFPAVTSVSADRGATVGSSAYCATAGCHVTSCREWFGSAHQSAGIDPAYLRSAALFESQRGTDAVRWCQSCHAPAVMVAGALAVGSWGSGPGIRMPNACPPTLNTPLQQEGINCLSCHATTRVTELSGNGRFELHVPSRYPFSETRDPRLRWLHGFLLRLRPGPHRLAFMKPSLHRQSEFCSSCHRTSYGLAQNNYKFLRTEDEYGTWQAGPYSGQSVHSFLPPGPVRQCQDCHNPHTGGVQSSVLGVRSSVPGDSNSRSGPNPLRRTPNTDPVTLDLLALRRFRRMPGTPEELMAPLDQAPPLLRPGEEVTVDLLVSNHRAGHEFPAGIGNVEAWLEMAVVDGSGRLLLRSGGRGRSGEISAGTHTYGMIGLDRHGRELQQGDLWNMVTPLYHRSILPGQPDTDRRTIQPGESDVVHYRLGVPARAVGPLMLRARLWRRKVVAGGEPLTAGPRSSTVSHRPAVCRPDTPAFAADPCLVAEDSITLPLAAPLARRNKATGTAAARADRSASSQSLPRRPLPVRFFDYGVGLLLQGDLPRAQRAMRSVQTLLPRDERGYLGLGRVYLTEGDLLAARAQFDQARRLAPADPCARAFLAATERRMGQYDDSLALLQPLVREYPRDRLLWFDLGMCHYLSGHYDGASQAFYRMLDIDPDDLSAHYNLMRCLRRLHRVSEARHEEVIYQTLREDDNAKQIGLAYLHTHPLADRETRTVHEHLLMPVTSNE